METEKNIEKPRLEKKEITPPVAERPLSPEIKTEQILSSLEKPLPAPQPSEKKGEGNVVVPFPPSSYQVQRAQAIDNILAAGLNEVFLKMTPSEQKEFKAAGEETVKKINKLFDKAKVSVSKVISLIRKWLKLIPRVNKFFLEQEAKIKADKIMKLKNKF
jgi:hypothetical protein